jgi:hypothetical protein
MQEEPLSPRLQRLEAVMECLDVPRVDAFPQPFEQFLDAPRRGRAPLQKGFWAAGILRRSRPAASHTNRVEPLGSDRRALLEAHLELPPTIAEVVLVQEPFIETKLQGGQLDCPCIMAGEPVESWYGVVLLPDAESMQVKVGPSKAYLRRGRGNVLSKRAGTAAWPRVVRRCVGFSRPQLEPGGESPEEAHPRRHIAKAL